MPIRSCLYLLHTVVSQNFKDIKTDSTTGPLSSTSPENIQRQTGGIFNKIYMELTTYIHRPVFCNPSIISYLHITHQNNIDSS